jgi:hypothetical protein
LQAAQMVQVGASSFRSLPGYSKRRCLICWTTAYTAFSLPTVCGSSPSRCCCCQGPGYVTLSFKCYGRRA